MAGVTVEQRIARLTDVLREGNSSFDVLDALFIRVFEEKLETILENDEYYLEVDSDGRTEPGDIEAAAESAIDSALDGATIDFTQRKSLTARAAVSEAASRSLLESVKRFDEMLVESASWAATPYAILLRYRYRDQTAARIRYDWAR